MVFQRLRQSSNQKRPINPIDIFDRLPKSSITDLYRNQAEVLDQWYTGRNKQQDFIIKLHTGGGKTLVGLLIAQSIINEHNESVLYLASTKQLVQQALDKANEYNIQAIEYDRSLLMNTLFNDNNIVVATYQALFNGLSRFGLLGKNSPQRVSGIIFDDAHTAFSTMRDAFTLRINKKEYQEHYLHLTQLFHDAFREVNRDAYLLDIVQRDESGVLEVPYWRWLDNFENVREYISRHDLYNKFSWNLIRDNFQYCHCFITRNAIIITPHLPILDMFPTYTQCPTRVFMSATIENDRDIIRTFNVDKKAIENPITSSSVAGVSERMIIVPQLTNTELDDLKSLIQQIIEWSSDEMNANSVILVSSFPKAEDWNDIGVIAKSEEVESYVTKLNETKIDKPIIFANRYDGIDLAHNACRLLIFSDLPSGINEYENFRMQVFQKGYDSTIAQRIEQGIGRASRGSSDYCIVILLGQKLVSWISKKRNLELLTTPTQAQINMGVEMCEEVQTIDELYDVIKSCLMRASEWISYHAEKLVQYKRFKKEQSRSSVSTFATTERKILRWMKDGDYALAIQKLESIVNSERDSFTKAEIGWIYRHLGQLAYMSSRQDLFVNFQRRAFKTNGSLMRPPADNVVYEPLLSEVEQAEQIIAILETNRYRRGIFSELNLILDKLVPESSANQYEQALYEIGKLIGFESERPENLYGKGPDVLWLLDTNSALVIEAKNEKKLDNPFKKEEHGQLDLAPF